MLANAFQLRDSPQTENFNLCGTGNQAIRIYFVWARYRSPYSAKWPSKCIHSPWFIMIDLCIEIYWPHWPQNLVHTRPPLPQFKHRSLGNMCWTCQRGAISPMQAFAAPGCHGEIKWRHSPTLRNVKYWRINGSRINDFKILSKLNVKWCFSALNIFAVFTKCNHTATAFTIPDGCS